MYNQTKYNKKLYTNIKELIVGYEKTKHTNKIKDLGKFCSSLEGIINCLESVSSSFRDSLMNEVYSLENIYDSHIIERLESIQTTDIKNIEQSISNIRKLIK